MYYIDMNYIIYIYYAAYLFKFYILYIIAKSAEFMSCQRSWPLFRREAIQFGLHSSKPLPSLEHTFSKQRKKMIYQWSTFVTQLALGSNLNVRPWVMLYILRKLLWKVDLI